MPVLGYLDDLLLIPLGFIVAVKLIPPDVLAECRARAQMAEAAAPPKSQVAAVVIVVIWVILAALCTWWAYELFVATDRAEGKTL